jgi:hypothetical protein
MESFEQRVSVASPLMDTFASYSTLDELRQQLAGSDWRVVEDSKSPARDGIPRFDTLTVAISRHTYRGQVGSAVLRLLNDRLASVQFFPEEPEACLAAMKASGLAVAFQEPGEAADMSVAPYTRVWCTRDYRGRVYVGWEDTRLAAQTQWWIERYA